MHRIDGDGHVANQFTEGNPITGQRGTEVTQDWLNAVQEEIAGVVEGAGEALDKADNGQLLAAIQTLITDALGALPAPALQVPPGILAHHTGDSAPAGWTLADGTAMAKAGAGAALWAHAQTSGLLTLSAVEKAAAPGLYYDPGGPNFIKPDIRGEFVRALDLGRGVDPGRAAGTSQGFAQQNVTGNVGVVFNSDNAGGASVINGAFASTPGGTGYSVAGEPTTQVNFDASRQIATDDEVRPRNVAYPAIIKL